MSSRNSLTACALVGAALASAGALAADAYQWPAHDPLSSGVRYRRTMVPDTATTVAAATGASHSMILKANGTVWAWGSNGAGQLWQPLATSATQTPVQVTGLPAIAAIAAGGNQSLALSTTGTVYQWGSGSATPTLVAGLGGIVSLTAGEGHAVAVRSNGKVFAWGDNTYGQLGNGTFVSSSTPVESQLDGEPAPRRAFLAVAGDRHTLVVRSNGTVYAYGSNASGQLGLGATAVISTPVLLGLTGIVGASAGSEHSVVSNTLGMLSSTGGNSKGQLGLGDLLPRTTFTSIPGTFGVTRLSSGDNYNLAVSGGELFSWGWTIRRENGSEVRTSPEPLAGFSGIVAISASSVGNAAPYAPAPALGLGGMPIVVSVGTTPIIDTIEFPLQKYVQGGQPYSMTITLDQPVTALGGLDLDLATSNPALVQVPNPVMNIPVGSQSLVVPLTTSTVTVPTEVTLLVHQYGNSHNWRYLVLKPLMFERFEFDESVVGGNSFEARVYLNTPAPAGGYSVSFASNRPGLTGTVNGLVIPEGQTFGSIMVSTIPVSSPQRLTITATFESHTRGRVIWVNPN